MAAAAGRRSPKRGCSAPPASPGCLRAAAPPQRACASPATMKRLRAQKAGHRRPSRRGRAPPRPHRSRPWRSSRPRTATPRPPAPAAPRHRPVRPHVARGAARTPLPSRSALPRRWRPRAKRPPLAPHRAQPADSRGKEFPGELSAIGASHPIAAGTVSTASGFKKKQEPLRARWSRRLLRKARHFLCPMIGLEKAPLLKSAHASLRLARRRAARGARFACPGRPHTRGVQVAAQAPSPALSQSVHSYLRVRGARQVPPPRGRAHARRAAQRRERVARARGAAGAAQRP